MSHSLPSTTPVPRPAVTADQRPSVCGCGQDLDVVTGRHCPRCGTQLDADVFDSCGVWFAA